MCIRDRYAGALAFVEPGLDEFPGEKIAIEIETRLRETLLSGHLPVAAGCSGMSPAVREYRNIGPGVGSARFEPVSYTHLDVYKRQALHLAPIAAPGCLRS